MQTIPASTRVLSNQPRSIRMFGSGSQVASGPAGIALRRAAVIVDSRSRRGIRGRVVTRAAQRPEPPRAFSTDLSDNKNLESLMEREAQPAVQVSPPAINPFPGPRSAEYRFESMDRRVGCGTIRPRVPSSPVSRPGAPRAPPPSTPVGTFVTPSRRKCSPRNYTHPVPSPLPTDRGRPQAEAGGGAGEPAR